MAYDPSVYLIRFGNLAVRIRHRGITAVFALTLKFQAEQRPGLVIRIGNALKQGQTPMKYSQIAALFMQHFRKRRIQLFASRFPPASCRTILDVGGTPQIWRLLGDRYQVTLLNPDARELEQECYECVVGDGRSLEFPDDSFDVAFSNSVIEHVGDWDDMQQMASELRRVGRCFYCQTPNKWFPVEPHLGTLFSPLVAGAAALFFRDSLPHSVGANEQA